MWNLPIETAPRDQLEYLQLGRLRRTVGRILEGDTVLADRLREAGVHAARDIASLAGLHHLPFTTKADLRAGYPFDLVAVPMTDVRRLHASSGTQGKPTVVAYTRQDLDQWTEVMCRCLTMAGVRPGMMAHNAFGYGLFTGGLGLHQALERIGCAVVPVSGGMTERQASLLRDFGSQVLCATPSYALHIAETLAAMDVDPSQTGLTIGVFGAEPWTEPVRQELERRFGLRAFDIYGLSEIVGPGVAGECRYHQGLHIQEDHFLPEVIDPATGSPLPPGQPGELVLTTLTKEAAALLRYRTGDTTTLEPGACPCGRTMIRMARVSGRYDDMLIIRGVNLYPSEVERVLLATGEVAPHYQIVIDRTGSLDELTVQVESLRPEQDPSQLQERLERDLRAQTGLAMTVASQPAGSLPRSEGKAVRVIDRRQAS